MKPLSTHLAKVLGDPFLTLHLALVGGAALGLLQDGLLFRCCSLGEDKAAHNTYRGQQKYNHTRLTQHENQIIFPSHTAVLGMGKTAHDPQA